MSEAFIWSRPNYRYCEVDLEGKIQVPFIRPAAESSDEATIGRAVYPGYLFLPELPIVSGESSSMTGTVTCLLTQYTPVPLKSQCPPAAVLKLLRLIM